MKIFEKTLNIAQHEMPRTLYAWGLLFLHRLGLIIGTTTLVAMFVTHFGINLLLIMIMLQAVLTILGMLVFSFLNHHFSSKKLIPICAFLTGLILFVSTFFVNQQYIFFALLLSVTGIFLPQLTIFLSNYIEDFFTPFECERTFPVIESAQTIGGIAAGFLIATLSPMIGSYKFFYVWILMLFLGVTMIFLFEPFSPEQHHFFQKKEHDKRDLKTSMGKIVDGLRQIKLFPFLQGLLIIFFLHWMVAYILEFQYTKLIDETLSAATNSAASHEEGLTHGLGSFHMLFHSSALVVQLIAASRILRKLGTVGSFLLHGVVTFFSSVSLLFGFGYFTVILAKNNFELSGIVHKNAYESSYYALRHGTQRDVREFFEAFVYPLGTIVGTVLVLILQFLGQGFLPLQILLVVLTLTMIVFAIRLKHSYTQITKQNLVESEHRVSKLHAIELLAQKGHKDYLTVLVQTLKKPNENLEVKIKILEIFYKIKDQKTLPIILEFLHSEDEELVYYAVKALGAFGKLGQNVFDQGFSRYRVIEELKKLFTANASERVRAMIIRTLAILHYEEIVPFLLEVMKGSSERLKVACIEVCALFDDPVLADYLLPFLHAESPFVRAYSALALWQFPHYQARLRLVLNELGGSTNRDDFYAYALVIGEIGNKSDREKLLARFEGLEPLLKITAAFGLIKLGYEDAGTQLVHLLFDGNLLVLEKAKELFCTLKADRQKFLQNIARRFVSQKLQPHLINDENVEVRERCVEAYLALDMRNEAGHITDAFEHVGLKPFHAF